MDLSEELKWTKEYQSFQRNPPKSGQVLSTIDGSPVRLDVELVKNNQPFIYARAFIPCIVGQSVGWFLQSVDSKDTFGLKCILVPKARDDLMREKGIDGPIIRAKSLRILRASKSGQSLLCEVSEW